MSERHGIGLVLAFIAGYLVGWEVYNRQQKLIIKDMEPEPRSGGRL